MYKTTDCRLRQNGNMLQEVVSIFQCIHGADHIPVTTKGASLLTSNHCAVTISTMVTYMLGKLDHTNQTSMDYMICPETLLNGHAVHTILQLTSSSTTCSQTMNIMQHHRILR